MIKENRMAQYAGERRSQETKRVRGRKVDRCLIVSRRRFPCERFNPSSFRRLLFPFFLLFFYHGPAFPWALTSLRGRKAVLRTSLSALCYIQEGITTLTSFVSSSPEILCRKSKWIIDTIADYTNELVRGSLTFSVFNFQRLISVISTIAQCNQLLNT